MTTWLIDTPLLGSLAPGPSPSFRNWLETHEDPIFLSAASLLELQGAIIRIPAVHAPHAEALRNWLNGIVSDFGDRIHPIGNEVALRAGTLRRYCLEGNPLHRFHDALLVATAQVHDHGLLTERSEVFGAWTNVEVASP